jgi:hypothetical protein
MRPTFCCWAGLDWTALGCAQPIHSIRQNDIFIDALEVEFGGIAGAFDLKAFLGCTVAASQPPWSLRVKQSTRRSFDETSRR